MPRVISCPHCAMQLRVPDSFAGGSTVKCPKCSATFQLPLTGDSPAAAAPPLPPTPPTPPTPATPATPPTDFSARPTSPAPTPAASWGTGPERAESPRDPYQRSAESGLAGLSNDYRIDLNEYFNLATKHYTAVLGPMIGYIFVLLACFLPRVIPCLGPCLYFILALTVDFALTAGFWVVCLKQLRGETWAFGDFFGGFQHWVPLFLNNLLHVLLSLIFLGPGYGVIAFAQVQAVLEVQRQQAAFVPGNPPPVLQQPQPDPALLLAGLGLLFLGLVPFFYLYLRCFLFNTLLIVDRGCNTIDAVKGTWLLTSGHVFGWLGTTLLLGLLVGVCAVFTCGIGALFAAPLQLLVMTAAWLSITDRNFARGPAQ